MTGGTIGQLQFTRVENRNFTVVKTNNKIRLRLGGTYWDISPGDHPSITSDDKFINVSFVTDNNTLEIRRYRHEDIDTTLPSEYHTMKLRIGVKIVAASPAFKVGDKFYIVVSTERSVDLVEYQFNEYDAESELSGTDSILTYTPKLPPIPPPQSQLASVIDVDSPALMSGTITTTLNSKVVEVEDPEFGSGYFPKDEIRLQSGHFIGEISEITGASLEVTLTEPIPSQILVSTGDEIFTVTGVLIGTVTSIDGVIINISPDSDYLSKLSPGDELRNSAEEIIGYVSLAQKTTLVTLVSNASMAVTKSLFKIIYRAKQYSLIPGTDNKIRIENVRIEGSTKIRFSRNVRYVTSTLIPNAETGGISPSVIATVFGITIFISTIQGTRITTVAYNTLIDIVSATSRIIHGMSPPPVVTHAAASGNSYFLVLNSRRVYAFNLFLRLRGEVNFTSDIRGLHVFDTVPIALFSDGVGIVSSEKILNFNTTAPKTESNVTDVSLASPSYIYSEYPWNVVVGVNSQSDIEEKNVTDVFTSRPISPSPEHLTIDNFRVRVNGDHIIVNSFPPVLSKKVVALGLTSESGLYYLPIAMCRKNLIEFSEIEVYRYESDFAADEEYSFKFPLPDMSGDTFFPMFNFISGSGLLLYINSDNIPTIIQLNLRFGTITTTRTYPPPPTTDIGFAPNLTTFSRTFRGFAVVGVSNASNLTIHHGVVSLTNTGSQAMIISYRTTPETTNVVNKPYVSTSLVSDDYFYFANRLPRYVSASEVIQGESDIGPDDILGDVRIQDYTVLFFSNRTTKTVSLTGVVSEYDRRDPALNPGELLIANPDLSGRYIILKQESIELGEIEYEFAALPEDFNETVHSNQSGPVVAPIYRSSSQTQLDLSLQILNFELTRPFTIGLNLDYAPGDIVRISSSENSRVLLKIEVTEYSRQTGLLNGILREISGRGVIDSWNVNLDVRPERSLEGQASSQIPGRVVSLFGKKDENFATLVNISTDSGKPYHVNQDLDELFTSQRMKDEITPTPPTPPIDDIVYISDIPDAYFQYLSSTFSTSKTFVRASQWEVYRYQRDGAGVITVVYPNLPTDSEVKLTILSGNVMPKTKTYPSAQIDTYDDFFVIRPEVPITTTATNGFVVVNVHVLDSFDIVIDGIPIRDPRGVPSGHSIPSGYFSSDKLVLLVNDVIQKENAEGYDVIWTYESPYLSILEDALREQRTLGMSDVLISPEDLSPKGDWTAVWNTDITQGFEVKKNDIIGKFQATRFILRTDFPGRFERFEGNITNIVGYIFFQFKAPLAGPVTYIKEVGDVVEQEDVIASILSGTEQIEYKAQANGTITSLPVVTGEGDILYELRIPVEIPTDVNSEKKSVNVLMGNNLEVEQGNAIAEISYVRRDVSSLHEAVIENINGQTRVEFFSHLTSTSGVVNYDPNITVGRTLSEGDMIASITYDQPFELGDVTFLQDDGVEVKEYSKILTISHNGISRTIQTPVPGKLIHRGRGNLFQIERERIEAEHPGIISDVIFLNEVNSQVSALQSVCTIKLTTPIIIPIDQPNNGSLFFNGDFNVGSRVPANVPFLRIEFPPQSVNIVSNQDGIVNEIFVAAPRNINNLSYVISGLTVTVTSPGHGLGTGFRVQVNNPVDVGFGASEIFFVTAVTPSVFTFRVSVAPVNLSGNNLSLVVNPNIPLNPDTQTLLSFKNTNLLIQTPFLKIPGLSRPVISVTNTNIFYSYIRLVSGLVRYTEHVLEKRSIGNVIAWQNVTRLPEASGERVAHGFGLLFDLVYLSLVRERGSVEMRIYDDFSRGRQRGTTISSGRIYTTFNEEKFKRFKVLVSGGISQTVYVFGQISVRRIIFSVNDGNPSVIADGELELDSMATNLIGTLDRDTSFLYYAFMLNNNAVIRRYPSVEKIFSSDTPVSDIHSFDGVVVTFQYESETGKVVSRRIPHLTFSGSDIPTSKEVSVGEVNNVIYVRCTDPWTRIYLVGNDNSNEDNIDSIRGRFYLRKLAISDTVSYTRTGTSLEVIIREHGFETGDIVTIRNPEVVNFNLTGDGSITKIDKDSFSVLVTDRGLESGNNLLISRITRQVEAREYQSAIDDFYNVYVVFRANETEAWMTKLDENGLPMREQLIDKFGVSPSIFYADKSIYISHVRVIRGFVDFVGLYIGKYDSFEFIKIWERGFVFEDSSTESFNPRIQVDSQEGIVKVCLVDSSRGIVITTLTTNGVFRNSRRLTSVLPSTTKSTELAFHYFSGTEYVLFPDENDLVNIIGDEISKITLDESPKNIITRIDEAGNQYVAYNHGVDIFLRRIGADGWENELSKADTSNNTIDFYLDRVLGLYITRGFPLVFSIRDRYTANQVEVSHQVQSVIYDKTGELIRSNSVEISAFSPEVFERIITGDPYIQFNPEDPENIWIVSPDPMRFKYEGNVVYTDYEIMVLNLFKRGDPEDAIFEKVLRNCHLGGDGDTKTFGINVTDEGPRECCLSRYTGSGQVTRKTSLGLGSLFGALFYLPRPDGSHTDFIEKLGRAINYTNTHSRTDRKEVVRDVSFAIERVLQLRFDILNEVISQTRNILDNQTATVTYGTSYFLSSLFSGTTQQIRIEVAKIASALDEVYNITLPKVGVEYVYQFVIEVMKRINITEFQSPVSIRGLRSRISQHITDTDDPNETKFREDEAAVMFDMVIRSLNIKWGTGLVRSNNLTFHDIFVELSSRRMIDSQLPPSDFSLGGNLISNISLWNVSYDNGVVTTDDSYFRQDDKLFIGGENVGQQVSVISVSQGGFTVNPSKLFSGLVPINNDADRADLMDAIFEYLTKVYSRPIPFSIIRRETGSTKINGLTGVREIMDYYIGNSELYTVVSKKLNAFNVFISVEVRKHNPVTLDQEWFRRINFSDDKEEFFKPRVSATTDDQVFVTYARQNSKTFLETFTKKGSRTRTTPSTLDLINATRAIETQVSGNRIFGSASQIVYQDITVNRRLIYSIPRLNADTVSSITDIINSYFDNLSVTPGIIINLDLGRVELTYPPEFDIETDLSQTLFFRGFRNTILEAESLGGVFSTFLGAVASYGLSDPTSMIVKDGEYVTYIFSNNIYLSKIPSWNKDTGWIGGSPDDIDVYNDVPVVFSLRNNGGLIESKKFDYLTGDELDIDDQTKSLISTHIPYPTDVTTDENAAITQSALICRLPWTNVVVATYRQSDIKGIDSEISLRLFAFSANKFDLEYEFEKSPLTHNQITSNEDGFQYFVYVNDQKKLILRQANEIGEDESIEIDQYARHPRVSMLPGERDVGISYLIYSRGFTDTIEIKFKKYSENLVLLDESSVLLLDAYRDDYFPTPYVDTGIFVRFDKTIREVSLKRINIDTLPTFRGETTGTSSRFIYSIGSNSIGIIDESKKLLSEQLLGEGRSNYRVANTVSNTYVSYSIGNDHFLNSFGLNTWNNIPNVTRKTDKLVVVGDFPAVISVDHLGKKFFTKRYRFDTAVEIEDTITDYFGILNPSSVLETWSPYETAVVISEHMSGILPGFMVQLRYDNIPTLAKPAINIPRSDVTISQYQERGIRVDNNEVILYFITDLTTSPGELTFTYPDHGIVQGTILIIKSALFTGNLTVSSVSGNTVTILDDNITSEGTDEGNVTKIIDVESIAKLRLLSGEREFGFNTLTVDISITPGNMSFASTDVSQGNMVYIESQGAIGIYTISSVTDGFVNISDSRLSITGVFKGYVTRFDHMIEPESFGIASLLIRRTRFGFRPVITREGDRIFMTFMRDITAFFRVVSTVTVRINLDSMKADNLLVRAFGELSSETFYPQTCVRGNNLVRFIVRQDNRLYYDETDIDALTSIRIWRDGTREIPVNSEPEIRVREYNGKVQVFYPDQGLKVLEYSSGTTPSKELLTSPDTNPVRTIIPNKDYVCYRTLEDPSSNVFLIRMNPDLSLEKFDVIEGEDTISKSWKVKVSTNEKLGNLFIFDDYPIVVTGVTGTSIIYHKFYDQSNLAFVDILNNQDLKENTPLPATEISSRETDIVPYIPDDEQLVILGDEPWENIRIFYRKNKFTDYISRTEPKRFDKATPPFINVDVDGVLRRGGQQVREHQLVSDETINSWYTDHTKEGGLRLINFRVTDRLSEQSTTTDIESPDSNGFWPAISLHQNGYVVVYTRSLKTFTESQEVVIRAYNKSNVVLWEEVEKMPDIVSIVSSRNKGVISYPVPDANQQAQFTTFKPRVRVVGDVVCVVYVRFNRKITVSVRRFEDGSLVTRLVNEGFRPISPDEVVLAGVRDLFVGEIDETDININIAKYRVNTSSAQRQIVYTDDDKQLINPADPTSEQASVKNFLRMSQSTNGQLNISYQAVIDPDKTNGTAVILGNIVTVSFQNKVLFGRVFRSSSYIRSGTTVTVTTPQAHNLRSGKEFGVISASGGLSNKTYTVGVVINSTQFTFQDQVSGDISGSLTVIVSGFIWLEFVNTNNGRVVLPGRLYKIDSISSDDKIYTISFPEYTGIAYEQSGKDVTITTPSAHNLVINQMVIISEATNGLQNLTYAVSKIISPTQFIIRSSVSVPDQINGTVTVKVSGFSEEIGVVAKDDQTDSRGDQGSGIYQVRLFAISSGTEMRKIWSRRNIIRGQEVGIDLPVRPDPTTLVEPLEPIFPSSLISEGSFIMLTKVFAEEIEELPGDPDSSIIALYNTVYSVVRNGLQPRTDHYIEVVRGPNKFQIRFTSLPYVLVNRFEGWLLNVYLDWESKPQFYFINYAVGAVRVSFDSRGQTIAPPGETGYNYWWRPLLHISPGAELRGVTSTTGFENGLSNGFTERWHPNGLIAETFDTRSFRPRVLVDILTNKTDGSFTRNRSGLITVLTNGSYVKGDLIYIEFLDQLEESRSFNVYDLTDNGFTVQDPVRRTVIGGNIEIYRLTSTNEIQARRDSSGIIGRLSATGVTKGSSVYIRGDISGKFIVTRITGSTFEVMDGRVINWNKNGQWIIDYNPPEDPFKRRTFQEPSIPDNLIILPDNTYVPKTEGVFNLQGQKDGIFKEFYARKEFFYRANRTRAEEEGRLGYVVNEFLMYLSTIDDSFFNMRNYRGEEGRVSTSDLDLPVSITPMSREASYQNDLRVGVETQYYISVRPPPPLKPSSWSTDTTDHRLITGFQSVVVNRQGTGIPTTLDFNYLVKEIIKINVVEGSFTAPSPGTYVIRRSSETFEQDRSNVRVLLNQSPINLNLVRNFYPNYITFPGVVSGNNNIRIEEVRDFNYLWGSDSVWNSVSFGDGKFVAVGDGAVMYSINAVDWIRGSPSSELNSWREVVYANDKFVAVASTGVDDRIMTSQDGITWTSRPIPLSNAWSSVTFGNTFGNDLYVVVGASGDGSRVMTSQDGITWTVRRGAANALWSSVTFGNGVYVAVSSQGEIMRSVDGINWPGENHQDFISTFSNSWSSITFGNGIFVVVSSQGPNGGRVITSPDGISWTERAAPAANWTSVTFGNDIFMAVARNICMISSDGINWALRSVGIPNDWSGVAFGGTDFVIVSQTGSGNRVASSSDDGDSWTSRISAPRTSPFNGAVVWNRTNKLLISYFDVPLINRFSVWSQIIAGDDVILADPNNARNRIRLRVTSSNVRSDFLDISVNIDESIEPGTENIDFSKGVRVTFVKGEIATEETLIAVPETDILNPSVGSSMKITFDVPFESKYRILTNFLKSSISGRVGAFINSVPKQIQAGNDNLDLFRPNVNSLSQFIPRYIELGTLPQQQNVSWEFRVDGKNTNSLGSIIGVSLWSILYRLNPNDYRGTPKGSATWGTDQEREVKLGLVREFVEVVPVFYQRTDNSEYLEFINKVDTNNFRMRNINGGLVTVPVAGLKVDERFVGYYVGPSKVLHEFIFQERADEIIMRRKSDNVIVNIKVSDIIFPIKSQKRFFETGLLRGDDERSEDTFFRSGIPRSTTDVLQFRASNLTFFRTDKYESETPDAFFKYTEKNEDESNKLVFRLDEQKRRVGLFEDFNTSGTDVTTGNYTEGARTGEWTFGYVSGRAHEKGSFVNDLKNGPWTVLYDKSIPNKWEEITYDNGIFNGPYKLYYISGNLKEMGVYKKVEFGLGNTSAKNEVWKTYFDSFTTSVTELDLSTIEVGDTISLNVDTALTFETKIDVVITSKTTKTDYVVINEISYSGNTLNGKVQFKAGEGSHSSWNVTVNRLQSEITYDDGLRVGMYRLYYLSGNLREEGQYTNDNKSGTWTIYHDSPAPKTERIKEISIYISGNLSGVFISKYPSQRQKMTGTYTNNLKTGEWKTFFDAENEPLQLVENYTEGLLTGCYISFLRPNVKKEEGAYAIFDVGFANQSLKNGLWKFYINGILSNEGTYDRGLKVGQWIYYVRESGINVSKIEVYGQSGIGLQTVLQITPSKVTLNVLIPSGSAFSFGTIKTDLSGSIPLETFINSAPVTQDSITVGEAKVTQVGGVSYTILLSQDV